jgi:hypothetical protein
VLETPGRDLPPAPWNPARMTERIPSKKTGLARPSSVHPSPMKGSFSMDTQLGRLLFLREFLDDEACLDENEIRKICADRSTRQGRRLHAFIKRNNLQSLAWWIETGEINSLVRVVWNHRFSTVDWKRLHKEIEKTRLAAAA